MYLHARYFDPQFGVFVSPDPIGAAGGANAYAYGAGDSVNGTDRTGLLKDPCAEGNDIDPLCHSFRSSPLMSMGMGEFLNVITGPSGGILPPSLTAAVAEHDQQLILDGHGGAYVYTDADGTTSVTVDPAHTSQVSGTNDFVHLSSGLGIHAQWTYSGVQVAGNDQVARSVAGKIVNAPNTVLGLTFAWLSLGADANAAHLMFALGSVGNNGIQFPLTLPSRGDTLGLTIGNVILYRDFNGAAEVGSHELQHTYQGEALGAAYLPLHLLAQGISYSTTGTYNQNNWLEIGPENGQPWSPR